MTARPAGTFEPRCPKCGHTALTAWFRMDVAYPASVVRVEADGSVQVESEDEPDHHGDVTPDDGPEGVSCGRCGFMASMTDPCWIGRPVEDPEVGP